MRNIYVNQKVITQTSKLRTKLWLSLIPLCPVLIVVDPQGFAAYVGLTFWQIFPVVLIFAIAGIWYSRKVWRCPVCTGYLSNNIFTKFCPHCATYVAIPSSTSPVYTEDEHLYRGAAIVPPEEFAAMQANENQQNLIKRYRNAIIVSISITILFAGLGIFSDIQSDQVQSKFQFGFETIRMIVLYIGGTFSFCWCAIFLFYFDEWVLSRYNNFVTRILMWIYSIDLIKITFTFLGGLLLMACTLGIFGFWVFFKTKAALKLLSSRQ